MKKSRLRFLTGTLLLVFASCAQGEGKMEKIELKSPAFRNGETIPSENTCDGADISPALEWSGVPATAKSLAIISNDPDAPMGNWSHWVLYDLPPSLHAIPAGLPAYEKPSIGGTHGVTDFGSLGYGGPCPPSGTHRYFFRIYALDEVLGLKPGASQKQVEKAIQEHVLAQGELMGTYQRKRN